MKQNQLITILIFIILFISILYSKEQNVISKIETDLSDNKINYSTAIEYKIYSIYNDNKLPSQYKTKIFIPKKCATPIMEEMRKNWDIIEPETQTRITSFLDSKTASLDSTYISSGGRFQIHYTLSGIDAVDPTDNDNNGVPDHIETAGEVLEYVWYIEIDSLGYREPYLGYNNMMEVYFEDMEYYGWVQGGDNLHLNNDYSDFPGTPLGCLQVTAAHEFHHEVQYEYEKSAGSGWYMEITSTYMEDVVYDDVNDYLNYLPTWYQSPWESLTLMNGAHEYSACIFNHFLEEKFGNNIIKKIWSNSSVNIITCIKNVLIDHNTTIEKEFAEFEVWNYFTGSRADVGQTTFSEANLFPTISKQKYHNITEDVTFIENESAPVTMYPDNLSCNYIKCQNFGSDGYFFLTITGSESANWMGKLITEKTNGDFNILDISFENKIGTIILPNWSEFDNVIFIPTNVSTIGFPAAYSYTIKILNNLIFLENHDFYKIGGNINDDFEIGDSIGINVTLANYGVLFDSLSCVLNSENPYIELLNDSVYIGQMNTNDEISISSPFSFYIKDQITPHKMEFTVSVKSNDSLITEYNIDCLGGSPRIILLDDDNGGSENDVLITAMDSTHFIYKYVDVAQNGLDNLQLTKRETVIWSVDGSSSINSNTIDSLKAIFNSQTNLILFGENLGRNLNNETWCPFDTAGESKFSLLKGVDDDMLSKSSTNWLWTTLSNQQTNELIKPVDPRCHVSFSFPTNEFGGIIRHSENGRFVAANFPISSFNDNGSSFLSFSELNQLFFDFINNENNPPANFDLNSPSQDTNIIIIDHNQLMKFSWADAIDNNDKNVNYTFFINDNDNFRDLLFEKRVIDTNYIAISGSEFFNSIDLTKEPRQYFWGVFASDGKEVTLCNSLRSISICDSTLNFPSDKLSLLLPVANDTFFVAEEMSRDFSFVWESCQYFDNDTLTYCLEFYQNNDTINRFYTSDTFYSFIPSDLISIIDTAGTFDMDWTVYVTDDDIIIYSDSLRSLTLVDINYVAIENINTFPTEFVLHQNFPNPFNPITQINYEVPIRSHIQIAIYDLNGKKIKTLIDEIQQPGQFSTTWDAKLSNGEKVPSGLYFYRLQSNDFVKVKKCVLMK